MTDDRNKSNALKRALGDLSILKERDRVEVPLKPDSYMIEVGAKLGGVDKETAKIIYEIMIAAAILGPPKDKLN